MAPRVVVLGSGPAGCTAALYLSRANLAPIVYEGMEPGGQLTTTTEVDNFPGFPGGILGPALMENMKKQCERFGASFVMDEISSIDVSSRPFKLKPSYGEEIEADAIVIASGASARYIGLDNELRLRGHGVSACATCDGFFFQEVPVVVVGGGDSAMEEATFLTRFASEVIVVHRRDTLRASQTMQQRAFDNPKVRFVWNSQVVDVVGDEKVEGVVVEDRTSGERQTIDAKALFLAIGHTPNTKPFIGKIDTDDEGYIATKPGSSHTSVPGVFAAGDVQDRTYKQAITASGSGCMAALDCEHWLDDNS